MPSSTGVQPPVEESEKPSKPKRDTGFPEPLSEDRNTTLPHPEAILAADSFGNPTGPEPILDAAFVDEGRRRERLQEHVYHVPHFLHRRPASKETTGGMSGGDVPASSYGDDAGAGGQADRDDGLEEVHEGALKKVVHKVEDKLHVKHGRNHSQSGGKSSWKCI